jgi:methylated-DNA-[protein]-cysteine S-methyltransferase
MTLCQTAIDTPVGRLVVVAADTGLRSIRWEEQAPRHGAGTPADDPGHPVLRAAVDQLRAYLAGDRRHFELPLDPVGTDFQQAVWKLLREIPYGTTISYGEQARRLGDARKARAVGGANGRNPIAIVVPCHRVVGADGTLTGFAAGTDRKRWLLDHETRVLGA